MDDLLAGRDVYVRHTDINGHSSVDSHRVWDIGLFMAARERDCAKANTENKGGKARVEQITKPQYLSERKARK